MPDKFAVRPTVINGVTEWHVIRVAGGQVVDTKPFEDQARTACDWFNRKDPPLKIPAP